jgi:hypothetical protein
MIRNILANQWIGYIKIEGDTLKSRVVVCMASYCTIWLGQTISEWNLTNCEKNIFHACTGIRIFILEISGHTTSFVYRHDLHPFRKWKQIYRSCDLSPCVFWCAVSWWIDYHTAEKNRIIIGYIYPCCIAVIQRCALLFIKQWHPIINIVLHIRQTSQMSVSISYINSQLMPALAISQRKADDHVPIIPDHHRCQPGENYDALSLLYQCVEILPYQAVCVK